MDTAQFITIFLDINNEKAAERLYSRNSESYESILDAYNLVLEGEINGKDINSDQEQR